jgi:aryl-alcohol dehydrogenase-like predicted oxidoreductase
MSHPESHIESQTSAQREPARPGGTWRLAGRTVSRIGYGAMQLERLHGDRRAAIALLRRAVELGVDHFDTAHFYGNGLVNGLLAEALAPFDHVTVVSKVGAVSEPGAAVPLRLAQRPEELRAGVEDDLRSLGLEQIPVMNLRRADVGPGLLAEGEQLVDIDDQLAVMTALRDAGKVGAIGLGSVTAEGLRRALPAGIVCVQNVDNVVAPGDAELFALCRREGIAWVPFCPLGSAFDWMPNVADDPTVQSVARRVSATPAQVALAWLLARADNVLLIPGTTSIGHLESNVAAGALELDDAAIAQLDERAA